MDETSLHLLLRITARISACFFVIAFAGPLLVHLWDSPVGRWLQDKQTAALGGLIISHGIHVTGVAVLVLTVGGYDSGAGLVVLVGGAIAYALLCLTLLVNTDIGRHWPWPTRLRIESIALWFAWGIFAVAFSARVPGSPIYIGFALLVWAGAFIRITGMRKRRRQQALTANA